eukprot:scaffold1483_cov153-Skeletonema_menzelii.AAC.25
MALRVNGRFFVLSVSLLVPTAELFVEDLTWRMQIQEKVAERVSLWSFQRRHYGLIIVSQVDFIMVVMCDV